MLVEEDAVEKGKLLCDDNTNDHVDPVSVNYFLPNSSTSSNDRADADPNFQFRKGDDEEARKILPGIDKLIIGLESDDGFSSGYEMGKEETRSVEVKVENEEKGRGGKNPDREDLDLVEGRSNRQTAVSGSTNEIIRSEMFDRILLCHGGKRYASELDVLREATWNEVGNNLHENNAKKVSMKHRDGVAVDARSFNVPFEYNAIVSKWETIKVEDFKIDKDEVLVVNCLYRFRNLLDETVVVDSPRNMVLNTVRKLNPHVFIHGIVNGSYGAPCFVTRFREALNHFSALFDMLDTNVPCEDAQRLLIEKDVFGREAMNVISCEGPDRVSRAETYKQWQARNLRSGFTQLPLDREIMKRATDKVKGSYHEDFVIERR